MGKRKMISDLKMACFDIETTGLDWNSRILSLGVSYRNGDGSIHSKAWPIGAYDLFHSSVPIPQVRQEVLPILNQSDLLVGHNLTFDLSFLFKAGVLLPSDVKGKLLDTLTLARMTGPHERAGLDSLCAEYQIGTEQWRAKKGGRGVLSKVPVMNLLEYNQEDTKYNLLLGEKLWNLGVQQYDPSFLRQESDFCRIMAQVRNLGMGLDAEKVYKRIQEITIQKANKFNKHLWENKIEGPNDRTGLLRYLKKYDISTNVYTDKGNESLDEASVIGLINRLISKFPVETDADGHDIEDKLYYDSRKTRIRRKLDCKTREIVDVLDAVLACRGWEKEINTWLRPMVERHAAEDGRVHPLYTVSGAVTYRLTCSEPGLQAIPDLDIWEPHHVFDYSQAEYRQGALYAKDNDLAQKYMDGFDAHMITAMRIYEREVITKAERHDAKTVNFAANYGAGAERLASQLGVSVEEAKKFLALYKRNLPKLFQMAVKVKDVWQERGYIKLWSGKRKYANSIKDQKDRSFIAWNALLQGGVAELTMAAMRECDKRNIPMLGQVHDSIKFPVGIDVEEVYEIMTNALPAEISAWTNPPLLMKVEHEQKF
jgi:DNA polymerase-1